MLGVPWVLEHQRTLQVFRAVQSASELEVTAQVRASIVERAQNRIGFARHKANIAISGKVKASRPPGVI
jgi:hypothetical protein